MNWIEVYKLNEFLQVFSLLVAFLILAVFGMRKTWITTDSIILMLIGFGYAAFPKHLIKAQTVSGGSVLEENTARYLGVTLICSGLCVVRSKESTDPSVSVNTLTSRIFTSSILLILQVISYLNIKPSPAPPPTTHPPSEKNKKVLHFEWSDQMLLLEIFATSLWLLGSFMHLFKSYDVSKTTRQSQRSTNNHLRLDSLAEILMAVFLLAFPAKIAKIFSPNPTNKVLLHLIRSVGAFKIGFGLQSLEAPSFESYNDKRDVFFIRLFNGLLGICYFLLLLYLNQIGIAAFYIMSLIHVPCMLNAVVGALYRPLCVVGEKLRQE